MQEALMVSDHEAPGNDAAEEPWLVLRPASVLLDLPLAYRWEVTRRHPYYLRFWQLAHGRHHHPSSDPQQRALEETAVAILLGIGVSGEPSAPGSSPESLGAGCLSQAWESGAVAPVTFRGLVSMLLADLPPELLVLVGRLLQECGTAAGQEPEQKYRVLMDLNALRHPVLDAFPGRPVVGVNIDAPQRTITQALEQFTRKWKEQRGIPERRRRDDKLAEYLAVWDLREGWRADHYDSCQERSLLEIAQQIKVPLSTVANRYRSAFRLIIGRDYSPALWARVLGYLKACEWLDPAERPRRTLQRPWRNRQPRAVPESALQAPGAGAGATGLLNTAGVSEAEIAYVDLVLDVQQLLAEGRSNAEIAAALELTSPNAEEAIDYLRQRRLDPL
jgi:hypothetical protein